MSKIEINLTDKDNAKFYVDGIEIKFVKSCTLKMESGCIPEITLKIFPEHGTELIINESELVIE